MRRIQSLRRVTKNLEEAGGKDSRKGWIRHILAYVVLGTLLFFSTTVFTTNYNRKKAEHREKIVQVGQVQQEIGQLEEENKALKKEISFLKTNGGVEEVAREKLGLIKPQEIAFVVISTPSPLAPAAAPTSEQIQEDTTKLKKEIEKESSKSGSWFWKLLGRWGLK
jgi:cell division protein FtsL